MNFEFLIDIFLGLLAEKDAVSAENELHQILYEYFAPYSASEVLTWTVIRRLDYLKVILGRALYEEERCSEISVIIDVLDGGINYILRQIVLLHGQEHVNEAMKEVKLTDYKRLLKIYEKLD